jgi:hypothetical protein
MKNNETKKFKIKEIRKSSIPNRLKLDDYNYFIRNNLHFLGISTLAAAGSIYGFIKSFENNYIFLSLISGMLSIQFLSIMFLNTKQAIETNNEKNKYINNTYKLLMRN